MKFLKVMGGFLTLCLTLCLCLSLGSVRALAAGTGAEEASARILQAVEAREAYVDVSAWGLTVEEACSIFEETVYTNNPQIIYVWSYGYSSRGGIVQQIYPRYDATVTPERQAEYESRMERLLADVAPGLSDLEKALVLHDSIAMLCEYDESLTFCEGHNALCDGLTVCRGYSRLYIDALRRVGVTARYVSSREMSHAWVMVKLEGRYYHVDLCWDDAIYSEGTVRHEYFLKSDGAFRGHSGWSRVSALTGERLDAADTRYDDMFWEDVTAPIIVTAPGELYYVRPLTGKPDFLGLFRRQNGAEQLVSSVYTPWQNGTRRWGIQHRSGLFRYEGGLFFNGPDAIYRFDLTDGGTETVYTYRRDGSLCGMALRRGESDWLNIELSNDGGSGRCLWLTSIQYTLPRWAA